MNPSITSEKFKDLIAQKNECVREINMIRLKILDTRLAHEPASEELRKIHALMRTKHDKIQEQIKLLRPYFFNGVPKIQVHLK